MHYERQLPTTVDDPPRISEIGSRADKSQRRADDLRITKAGGAVEAQQRVADQGSSGRNGDLPTYSTARMRRAPADRNRQVIGPRSRHQEERRKARGT